LAPAKIAVPDRDFLGLKTLDFIILSRSRRAPRISRSLVEESVMTPGGMMRLLSILCSASGIVVLLSGALPVDAATPTAHYTVTFDAAWSQATHPTSFPPGPHWSPLVGGTHNASVSFWKAGQIASQGIEDMAELGATNTLASEVSAAITAGNAASVIVGGGISPSPGSTSVSFTIGQDFPLVTLVSMIAPSPDWFVGISGLPLLENGEWVAQKTVTLWLYDAGTDGGTNYTSPNLDTNPQIPISLHTTLPGYNGVPMGTFTFTRTDVTVPAAAPPGVALLAVSLIAASALALRRARRA